MGKFNIAIEHISKELVRCGCLPDQLEEVLEERREGRDRTERSRKSKTRI